MEEAPDPDAKALVPQVWGGGGMVGVGCQGLGPACVGGGGGGESEGGGTVDNQALGGVQAGRKRGGRVCSGGGVRLPPRCCLLHPRLGVGVQSLPGCHPRSIDLAGSHLTPGLSVPQGHPRMQELMGRYGTVL